LPAFLDNFLYREIDPRPLLGGAATARDRPPLGRAVALDLRGIAAVGRLIQHPHREAVGMAGG
jgi:hypothetical protein